MQWLIDMVIEAIGVPPTFIDRGDPITVDFDKADFTLDDAWHELDLSGIVPEGATGIAFTVTVFNTAVGKFVRFRRAGNIREKNITEIGTQVANLFYGNDGVVSVNTDRKIEYKMSGAGWIVINMTVKGWWL